MTDIQLILIYLVTINVATFFTYGIDKWKAASKRELSQTRLESAEHKQFRSKTKAKKSLWRIRESALLGLAILGGSIGAWLGMKVWHHKTMHKGETRDVDNIVRGYQFKYGIPLILAVQIVLLLLVSCKSQQTVELSAPIRGQEIEQEHSPHVFLVMYDAEVGKEPLQKAIKDYKCEVIYDYKIIHGMALKKPESKTLEETMHYFRGVKGVLSVEYDRINHLVEPVRPRLETK